MFCTRKYYSFDGFPFHSYQYHNIANIYKIGIPNKIFAFILQNYLSFGNSTYILQFNNMIIEMKEQKKSDKKDFILLVVIEFELVFKM